MNIQLLDNSFDKDAYNEKAAHPLQSWEWGQARDLMGIEVVRIGEFDGEALLNVFQLTLHPIPFTSYKIGYLPRSNTPSESVLSYLAEFGKKQNIIFIKLEPNDNKNPEINEDTFKIKNLKFKIVSSPHQLFPDWTIVLPLNKTEEEMLADMKQKTRYNVRLAEKKGVIVKEESNDEGYEKFIKLYFETCARQKYYGHNHHFHKTVWNTLKGSLSHILIAYFENEPIAAYELFYFNNVFYYPYGGTSLKHRNVMGANLLMWEAIRLGKKLGATEFDMWGSLPPNFEGDSTWGGFTRFKEGYNGRYVQKIGSFDVVINPILYKMYNFANILRGVYLKLRKLV